MECKLHTGIYSKESYLTFMGFLSIISAEKFIREVRNRQPDDAKRKFIESISNGYRDINNELVIKTQESPEPELLVFKMEAAVGEYMQMAAEFIRKHYEGCYHASINYGGMICDSQHICVSPNLRDSAYLSTHEIPISITAEDLDLLGLALKKDLPSSHPEYGRIVGTCASPFMISCRHTIVSYFESANNKYSKKLNVLNKKYSEDLKKLMNELVSEECSLFSQFEALNTGEQMNG